MKVPFVEIIGHFYVDENNNDNVVAMFQRPQWTKITPTRLQGCEVIGDNKVTTFVDLVHFALLVDAEPINHNQALRNKEWKDVMIEKLEVIKRNKTW